jgi:hypothetical protein
MAANENPGGSQKDVPPGLLTRGLSAPPGLGGVVPPGLGGDTPPGQITASTPPTGGGPTGLSGPLGSLSGGGGGGNWLGARVRGFLDDVRNKPKGVLPVELVAEWDRRLPSNDVLTSLNKASPYVTGLQNSFREALPRTGSVSSLVPPRLRGK